MSTPIEPKRGTQASKVLAHIKVFGFITQKEATRDLAIYSLPARIFELKKMGWPVLAKRARASQFSIYSLDKSAS